MAFSERIRLQFANLLTIAQRVAAHSSALLRFGRNAGATAMLLPGCEPRPRGARMQCDLRFGTLGRIRNRESDLQNMQVTFDY